jgi:hypothetical protein
MPGKARKRSFLLAAITLVAVLAAGCGEDRSNLIPGDTAAEIDANLVLVGQLVREGDCFEALRASEEVRDEVEALGTDVDPTLRRSLLDGVTQLQIKVQDDCVQADTAPDVEPSVPEAPPEDSESPETGPGQNATGPNGDNGGANQPQPDPQPEPEPAPRPQPEPTPEPPTPPDDGSGGVGPPGGGGVSPPTGGA